MPRYIKAALHNYQHPAPTRPEHATHMWNPPVYGAKTQNMEYDNNPPYPPKISLDNNNLRARYCIIPGQVIEP
jgi:hypothetical protein